MMIRLQEIEQTMKRLTTIIIALSAAGMVSAQNLTAEIDVERTVVPRLTLQSPLPSVFPSVIPSTSSPMSLTLSEYSGGAVDYTSRPGGLLGPRLQVLPAARLTAVMPGPDICRLIISVSVPVTDLLNRRIPRPVRPCSSTARTTRHTCHRAPPRL